MNALEVLGLTKDYGKNRGVFDLCFSIKQGEAFGFLGPNGAGKTTTIRHLLGFLKPDKGVCKIYGLDCWQNSAKIQKNLGYIPGEMAFFDDMSGEEFLRFLIKYKGIKTDKLMLDLTERFELDFRAKLKKMSKGMKQKVGIIAAFMHDPEVLILDEPTSGLDPLMQNRFIDLILEEKKKGKTILMSSHMFEEVERTCHRVSIIKNGRLAAIDSVDVLKQSLVKKYVIQLDSIESAVEFSKDGLDVLEINGNNVTVSIKQNIKELIALMNKYPVINISAPNQSLEEIFLQYYGEQKNL